MDRPWHKHPLVRRLPILAVAAFGIWLWQGGEKEREIHWQLPPDHAAVERVEIQLRDASGTVVEREALFFPKGAPSSISHRARLSDGQYQAEVFLFRTDAQEQVLRRPLQISGETASARLW